jgi:hypothetical protein
VTLGHGAGRTARPRRQKISNIRYSSDGAL